MAMPFCGPENARSAVKNSVAVAFRRLARITTYKVNVDEHGEEAEVGNGIADRPMSGG